LFKIRKVLIKVNKLNISLYLLLTIKIIFKMAKSSSGNNSGEMKKKRPGIHSKNKNSRSKGAKYYKKQYKGQGK
tara:strand:+ start:100 stop:321 length:222 start_codon:yes stop_codon:yes gene_type:complete